MGLTARVFSLVPQRGADPLVLLAAKFDLDQKNNLALPDEKAGGDAGFIESLLQDGITGVGASEVLPLLDGKAFMWQMGFEQSPYLFVEYHQDGQQVVPDIDAYSHSKGKTFEYRPLTGVLRKPQRGS